MSTYLTVRQFGNVGPEHRATLASLPGILRLTDAAAPDIALTASDEASLKEALSVSPKAIVVAEPATLDDAGWKRLTDASSMVFPALTLAANLRQISAESVPSKPGLIHSRLSWQGGAKAAIVEHLAGLATVVGQLFELQFLSYVSGGYVGSAKTGEGVEVAWSGLAGAPLSFYELDVVGLADRLEVRADLDGSARPLLLRRGHAGGLDQPAGFYETGLRRFWREAADLLRTGEQTTTLQDIADIRAFTRNLDSIAPTSNERAA
jgi:hypothetical protein